jgi:hypothetical protein
MPDLKMAALIATALLGSTTMIGTAAAMPSNALPETGKQVSANVQDARYQPDHWWRGWRRWGCGAGVTAGAGRRTGD